MQEDMSGTWIHRGRADVAVMLAWLGFVAGGGPCFAARCSLVGWGHRRRIFCRCTGQSGMAAIVPLRSFARINPSGDTVRSGSRGLSPTNGAFLTDVAQDDGGRCGVSAP